MNKILVTIVISLTVLSCTSTPPTPPPTGAQSSVSFLANGTLIKNINSNLLLKVTGNNNQAAGYVLESMNGIKYSLSLFLLTNSTVTTTTYNTTRVNYPSAELTVFNFPVQIGSEYSHRATGDFMNVTITQIQNGFANGTFTAQMSSPTNNPTTVSITNGEFTNVPIQN